MKEKKSININFSTFFLVLVILIILVMGFFMYKLYQIRSDGLSNEFTSNVLNETSTINGLTNESANVSSQNITTNNSNTPNIPYDVEISLSQLENINVIDNAEIEAFYEKYSNKILKVTGYVSGFGDEYNSSIGIPLATGVNIGNEQTYQTQVYASGVTYDSNVIQKIHSLQTGEKISLIGTLPTDFWSMPIELYLTDIIKVDN